MFSVSQSLNICLLQIRTLASKPEILSEFPFPALLLKSMTGDFTGIRFGLNQNHFQELQRVALQLHTKINCLRSC